MNECWCEISGFHNTDVEDLGLLDYYVEYPATQSNNPENINFGCKGKDHSITCHEGKEGK
jgi:hypothetical protein